MAGLRLCVGRSFRAAPVTEWLLTGADFLRRGGHYEWCPTFRRAALDDRFRPTYVRPGAGSALRACLLHPLPTVHTFRVVELVLYRARLGGGRCGAGLGFRPAYRYHDPTHLARRRVRDDDHRASPPDQRASGGRLPLVSGGGGQYAYPVHLRQRRSVVGRKNGRLEGEVWFKVQSSRCAHGRFYCELEP